MHFDNKYALIEVKLGANEIPEAKEHLLKLKNLIKENQPKMGVPLFMMVITGTEIAYKTENNILVVPIGCLKN